MFTCFVKNRLKPLTFRWFNTKQQYHAEKAPAEASGKVTSDGFKPIHLAALHGHGLIAQHLLEKKVRILGLGGPICEEYTIWINMEKKIEKKTTCSPYIDGVLGAVDSKFL